MLYAQCCLIILAIAKYIKSLSLSLRELVYVAAPSPPMVLAHPVIDCEVHYNVLDMTALMGIHQSTLRQHGLPKRDK